MPDITTADENADRRTLICEAALDLAAEGGNRAVTHTGVDKALELPKGSTSYYFRTRRALLDATIAHLAHRSRIAFAGLSSAPPAEAVGAYLHDLVTTRARDVRARFALAPDAGRVDDGTAPALANALFSPAAAEALFTFAGRRNPADDAADLLVMCEGVAASHLFTGIAQSAREYTRMFTRRFGTIPPTA